MHNLKYLSYGLQFYLPFAQQHQRTTIFPFAQDKVNPDFQCFQEFWSCSERALVVVLIELTLFDPFEAVICEQWRRMSPIPNTSDIYGVFYKRGYPQMDGL